MSSVSSTLAVYLASISVQNPTSTTDLAVVFPCKKKHMHTQPHTSWFYLIGIVWAADKGEEKGEGINSGIWNFPLLGPYKPQARTRKRNKVLVKRRRLSYLLALSMHIHVLGQA